MICIKSEKQKRLSGIIFPFGYRDIGIKYHGYEIRMKPFLSYNIFYVVDATKNQITITKSI